MLWWKAVHIISVISWMAGLLYLFRLFIYHNQETEALVKERFVVMERRLMNVITTPAGILTWVSGLALVSYNIEYFMKAGWFHAKLLGAVLLAGMHIWGFFAQRRLLRAPRPYSNVGLRFLNEVPTLLMIGIVLLVVLKPF